MRISIMAAAVAAVSMSAQALELKQIGSFNLGEGEGFAEMVRYHAGSQQVFVTSSKTGTVEAVSIANLSKPSKGMALDLQGGDVTAVAVNGDLIAASIKDGQNPGSVKIFNPEGDEIASFETGALPDNLAFSPDGRFLVTANEGEPSDDYQVDPEGSFTVIDLKNGVQSADVEQISLAGIELPAGARLANPASTFAEDAEPEYVTIDAGSRFAYVTLQESNALAKLDLINKQLVSVSGFGFKNVSRTAHDMSNKDGGINMKRWPVMMMFQPDAIASYEVAGQTFLVTANEGDAKDYEGYSEETRVKDLTLDPTTYPNAAELQKPENLGRLKTTTANGDIDGDGDTDIIYAYGGRSFSIWNHEGELMFDSANGFERIIQNRNPEVFNANGGADEFDDRSDDKGPEPEALALGMIDGRTYAFIGMERNNALFTYDITNPADPMMVDYHMPSAMFNSPEGLDFIPAAESPTGKPLLVTAYEMTGNIAVYEIVK